MILGSKIVTTTDVRMERKVYNCTGGIFLSLPSLRTQPRFS
jgi:hypothetical protein